MFSHYDYVTSTYLGTKAVNRRMCIIMANMLIYFGLIERSHYKVAIRRRCVSKGNLDIREKHRATLVDIDRFVLNVSCRK